MKKLLVLLALSVVANAALVVTVMRRPAAASRAVATAAPAVAAATSTADASNTGLSPADVTALRRTGELFKDSDLRVLVARLRAAGFSSAVIRAIVTAQVVEDFGHRRAAAVAHQDVVPYWKNSQGFPNDPKAGAEIARLNREQTALLKELLGPDSAPSDEWSLLLQQRRYGHLSQEKIDRLQAITADYNDLRGQMFADARGMPLKEDRERLALLDKEQRADLEKLFTPAELEEYDLRNSPLSMRLRFQLSAFDATEEEFRTIFRLTQQSELANGQSSYGPGIFINQRAPGQDALQSAIAEALGPERAAEYNQSRDPAYQNAARILDRLDLPKTLAADIVATEKDVRERINAVQRDRSLSPSARTAQLTALAAEAESRLTQTLGARGYEAYLQIGGGWVRQIVPQQAVAPQPAILLPNG